MYVMIVHLKRLMACFNYLYELNNLLVVLPTWTNILRAVYIIEIQVLLHCSLTLHCV